MRDYLIGFTDSHDQFIVVVNPIFLSTGLASVFNQKTCRDFQYMVGKMKIYICQSMMDAISMLHLFVALISIIHMCAAVTAKSIFFSTNWYKLFSSLIMSVTCLLLHLHSLITGKASYVSSINGIFLQSSIILYKKAISIF